MTEDRKFKQLVRTRMLETGESYQKARDALLTVTRPEPAVQPGFAVDVKSPRISTRAEGYFDVVALWEAVDAHRVERGLTWQEFNREVGGSWTTMRRKLDLLANGEFARAGGGLRFVQWVGRTPESFTPAPAGTPAELLPDPGTEGWRWYWNTRETGAVVDAKRLALGLTWRQVADEMGCTVAQATALKRPGRTRPGWDGMGIVYHPLDVLMRAARWLERSAASFMWEVPARARLQARTPSGRRRLRSGELDWDDQTRE